MRSANVLTRLDGEVATDPAKQNDLKARGYLPCQTVQFDKDPAGNWRRCPFFLSPATVASVQSGSGYYTCPVCYRSYDLLHEIPWHGANEDEFVVGGGTRIGITMKDQGQIGEKLIQKLGELPGYGPITWWATDYNSPLDGATADWGIEVKTLGYDVMHHRFIPGRAHEKLAKNQQAADMGKKGVLQVLVMLDYRRSVADIYVTEAPLERGVYAFRTALTPRLLEEVPFDNPFMNPNSGAPVVSQPKDEIPF